MAYRFISIEGNIGSGKTTLATLLAEKLNARLLLEGFEDNPFLPDFYGSPEEKAFPMELYFMADRYRQSKELIDGPGLFNETLVTDFIFAKSKIFASVNLQEEELKLYRNLYEIINQKLPHPDIIIFLNVSTTELLFNIESRGRAYEKAINENYLRKLNESYFQYFNLELNVPILILDIEEKRDLPKTELNMLLHLLSQKWTSGIHRMPLNFTNL